MIGLQHEDGSWFSEFQVGKAPLYGTRAMTALFAKPSPNQPSQVAVFANVCDASETIEQLHKKGIDVTARNVLGSTVIDRFNKIVPVTPDKGGRIVAQAVVLAVFDTNSMGELMPVAYRQNPMDGIEVKLENNPFGQVYVLV